MSPEEETQQAEYDDAGPGGPGAPTPLSSLEVSLYSTFTQFDPMELSADEEQ